jgi:hypothetical protein
VIQQKNGKRVFVIRDSGADGLEYGTHPDKGTLRNEPTQVAFSDLGFAIEPKVFNGVLGGCFCATRKANATQKLCFQPMSRLLPSTSSRSL